MPVRYHPRQQLVARISDALREGHVLIEAPGGYGKTTLLRALAADRPATTLLALLPGDADLAALQARFDELLRQPDATLILDDVHLFDDVPEIRAWLAGHLRQPPERRARLVLAGRHLELPGSALLVAQRRLFRFGMADLAFSRAECRTLGIPEAWWQRAEGWPLALALIEQLVARETRLDVASADGELFDSLAQLVFADLPSDLVRFMRISAVPLRFNFGLAAALLETNEEQIAAWVNVVRRRALFLQSAEPEGWLRYHDLIREFLLRRQDLTLYWRRSVAWFEAQGDLPMAIEHALAGGLQEEAARLLEGIAATFVYDTGRYQTFQRWVISLDQARQAAHPLLLLRLGSDLQELGKGDAAEQYFARASAYARGLDATTEARVALGIATARVSGGAPRAALPLLEQLLADPGLAPVLRRAALQLLGAVHYYLGRLHAARQAYHSALAIDAETPETSTFKIRQSLINVALIPLGAFMEAREQLVINEAAAKEQLVGTIWHLLTTCWFHEAIGDWASMRVALQQLRDANLRTEARDEEDSAELMLRAIFHTGVGEWRAAEALLDRVEQLSTGNPDIALYTALCRAWLARREGRYLDAVAICDQALARPWDVPLTRSLVALEREIVLLALGRDGDALHPDVRFLTRARARHWLVRLRALLALRCYRSGDVRWPLHVRHVLREIHRPWYERLLISREPDLGARFWSLCVAEKIAIAEATAALREIGQIEPLLAYSRDADVTTLDRIATALAAIGDERAIPALVTMAATNDSQAIEQAILALEQGAPPLLRIRLMGQFSVTRGDAPVGADAWTRPAARRLFQYLVLHAGQSLHRDQILDDLWPEATASSALSSLKTTLSRMRKAIEPYLRPKAPARYFTVDDDLLTFGGRDTPAAGRIVVDVEDFVRTVTSALRRGKSEETPPFDELDATLRGWAPLLPDLLGETWTLAPRERLLDLYVRGCLYLAENLLAVDRLADAEHWASQVIAAAPWSEEAYQTLMRALARQGKRGQALRIYHDAVAALAREFDAPPAERTLWLGTRLRRGEHI